MWSRFRHSLDAQLTYNIVRPYPFGPIFKLLTTFGFLILLTLVILFSIANSAYELRPVYVTNPNETENQRYWFNAWPFTFGNDNLKPKCQPLDIQLGHNFMTTNYGLRYTVTAINFLANANASMEPRPSLPYQNSILKDCQVNGVDVHMTSRKTTPNPSDWWAWTGSVVATTQCEIRRAEGIYVLYFDTWYPGALDPHNEFTRFIVKDNATTSASLWWGARILNNYFMGIYMLLAEDLRGRYDDGSTRTLQPIAFGQLNYLGNSSVEEIRSHDLFVTQYHFLQWDGSINNPSSNRPPRLGSQVGSLYNNPDFVLSRPLTEGYFFAKVMRSLILTDLGDARRSNMLIHEDLLKYALDPDDNFNRGPIDLLSNVSRFDAFKVHGISPPSTAVKTVGTAVPMWSAYDAFKNQTGPLGTTASTIYAQYLCSVPQSRSLMTALLFSLVATMSLMQVAFIVFRWLAGVVVEAQDSRAMYCSGCIAQSGTGSSANLHESEDSLQGEQDVEMRSWDNRTYQPVDGR
jgi:hypothetical protein